MILEGMPDNGEHGPGTEIATVERREACVPFAWDARCARLAHLRAGHKRVHARLRGCVRHAKRVLAAPKRLSALRHPLSLVFWGWKRGEEEWAV